MIMETKERPILFSGPMVRAILEGRKTQTRRVVKPQGVGDLLMEDFDQRGVFHELEFDCEECITRKDVCPYGKPGDRLWVRETWSDTFKDGIAYRATANGVEGTWGAWKPSIHMKRADSRITLEVVSVRVERVQEISEADAKAEGPLFAIDEEQTILSPHLTDERNTGCGACAGSPSGIAELCHDDLRGKGRPFACWFAELWDSINAKRGFGWAVNPWVWVVEFGRVEGSAA